MRTPAILLAISMIHAAGAATVANAHPINAFGCDLGAARSASSVDAILPYGYDTDETRWATLYTGYVDWNLGWHRLGLLTGVGYTARGYSCELMPPAPLAGRAGAVPSSLSSSSLDCVSRRPNRFLSLPVLLARELGKGAVRPVVLGGASMEILLNRGPRRRGHVVGAAGADTLPIAGRHRRGADRSSALIRRPAVARGRGSSRSRAARRRPM